MMTLAEGRYTVTKLTPEITWIYDGINDSIYVDEAEDAAFVIDTGLAPESLIDLIREEITEKPLTLVVTHGHGDHVKKAGEFGKFYMSAKDDYLLANLPDIDMKNRIDIAEGDVIEVPGLSLVVADCHGHTPGSVFFIDHKHRAVFDGDAICNGRNMWMQLPNCTDLSAYAASLRHTIEFLREQGVDETYEFLGGHYDQRWRFRPEQREDNPPGFAMMEDQIALCEKLISGEIVPVIELDDRSFDDQAYNAHYGKAEMLFTLKQVR